MYYYMSFLQKMIKYNGTDFSLNYFFNLGSMLGFLLIMQFFSGLFLSMYYVTDSLLAFNSVQYVMFEINNGWLMRLLHFNGASFFFIILMLHMFKGLFFFSYRLKKVWGLGLMIFLFIMMEAFLGYVLVWSQMSFWAAIVITSLISVLPFFGKKLIFFIWGGYYLNNFTLKFFFLIHFLLPFVIFIFVFFHLNYLHFYGSSMKFSNTVKFNKREFFPYFIIKDFFNFIVLLLFILLLLLFPLNLGDFLGFVNVNNLVSPIHIVPEWYFLWAYAILRAISIKWVGVFMMLLSILVFFVFFLKKSIFILKDLFNFILLNFFLFNFITLIWLGSCEPLYPFIDLSFLFMLFYFFLIFMIFILLTIIMFSIFFCQKKGFSYLLINFF